MVSEGIAHRIQRVVPVLMFCILLLTTLAFVLSPAQATYESGISANEAAPESVTAGSADWPMPLYDVGRTRANLQELTFSAPFDPTPVNELTYDLGEAMRPAAITDNDMLFWYKTNESGAGDELVVATDLDGQRIWSFDIPEDFELRSAPPLVAGEEVFVAEYGEDDIFNTIQNVVALDRQTGAFLWRRPINRHQFKPFPSQIAVQDGIAYLSWWQDFNWNGFLTAVNARTGAVIWDIAPDNNGGSQAEALAITDNVLVALHYTTIVGYDLATGNELWEFDVADVTGSIQDVEDMVAVGGKVAFANTRIVGALDVTDGSAIWSHIIDVVSCDPYAVSAMASDGNDLFIMGMCRDQLRKYDLDTGIELWRETVDETEGLIALANNVVYLTARDFENLTGFISAHSAIDGQFLQRLDVSSLVDDVGLSFIPHAESFAVANGQLLAMVPGTTGATRWIGTLFVWESSGNFYLPLFNDDSSPDTNPDGSAEVSIIDSDGVYGAEIQVAAQIGSLTATLQVYDAGGGLYKEGITEPDEFGNGFWIAPLEYAGSGYEYQVILNDGTELARRQVLMPPDPAASVDHYIQSDGLSWVSPPAMITSAPYTLTLALPAGFPIPITNTFVLMNSTYGGVLVIPGVHVGGEVLIRLDENNAINGEHSFTAVASAGNVTAYSTELAVTIEAPELPVVRAQKVTAVQPNSDGSYTRLTFSFERQRPVVDPVVQADAQIARVTPDPSGYQVLLWVKTPPEDPLDPRTSKWEIGVSALDEAGNVLDESATEIPPAPDGRYLSMSVIQPGSRAIAGLAAFGSILENDLSRDLQGPEASEILGIFGRSYISMQSNSACVEPPWGPDIQLARAFTDSLLLKLHASAPETVTHIIGPRIQPAPRPSGLASYGIRCIKSVYSTNKASEYVTDFIHKEFKDRRNFYGNFGSPNYYTISEFRTGFSDFEYNSATNELTQETCIPKKALHYQQCCTGSMCTPSGNLVDPPGADHPDDTKSVVTKNNSEEDAWTYWRSVSAYALARGFRELAELARYRLLELSYLEVIGEFSSSTDLTDEQRRVVASTGKCRRCCPSTAFPTASSSPISRLTP